MSAPLRPRRLQLRQPPLAELVAETLRRQITGGALLDGDLLPPQEELLEEFGVSKPSLRQALRILETEGLITVQRGNVGGARVHAPQVGDAGYMIGLVLQARNVSLDDVGQSLQLFEPLCAGLCAGRPDRRETVLPQLETIHRAMAANLKDDLEFTRQSHRFHETLVASCGSQTVIVVVGALEALWSARQDAWALRTTGTPNFPGTEVRQGGVKAHARIIELIKRGDSGAVTEVARKHLETIERYTSPAGEPIAISAVRDRRAPTLRSESALSRPLVRRT